MQISYRLFGPKQQYLNDWERFCAFASRRIKSLQSVQRRHRILLEKSHKKLRLMAINERKHTGGRWVDAYARVAIKEEKYILARLAVERGVIFNYLLPAGEDFKIYEELAANNENKWEVPDIESRLASELKNQYHFSDKKAAFFAWLMKKKGLTQELCEYIANDYQDSKQDLDRINEFIMHGAGLNSLVRIDIGFEDEYLCPLHIAVSKGHGYLVHELLLKGADVELRDGGGYSPLLYACTRDESPEVLFNLLVDHKAKIEVMDNSCKSPLNVISYREKPDKKITKFLLENGYDADHRDSNGESALHESCLDEAFAKLLLATKPNIYILNSSGRTPVLELCLRLFNINSIAEHKPFILLLLRDSELIDEWDPDLINNTVDALIEICRELEPDECAITDLFQMALKKKHAALLRILIEQGADIWADNSDNLYQSLTSWEEAEKVDDGNYSFAQLSQWLRQKRSIFDKLRDAVHAGAKNRVEDLIEQRLPPCFLFHAFLHAIENMNMDIIELFLVRRPAGFDIMSKNHEGNTALHIAVLKESVELVNMVLPHFYSIDIKNKQDENPIDLALDSEQTDIINACIESGAMDVNSEFDWNNTMLDLAIYNKYVKVVKYLLQRGDASLPDVDRWEHELTSPSGREISNLLKKEQDRREGKEPVNANAEGDEKVSGSRKWSRSRSNSSSDSKHADSKRSARGTERPGDDDMSDED